MLCVPCIILQCVNDQQDAQILQSILFHSFYTRAGESSLPTTSKQLDMRAWLYQTV